MMHPFSIMWTYHKRERVLFMNIGLERYTWVLYLCNLLALAITAVPVFGIG